MGFDGIKNKGAVEHMTQTILLLPMLYVILQWWALRRMREAWQVAAAVPAVFMAGGLAAFVIGILTGADLAALWLVIGMPLATAYLLLLFPVYWAVSGMQRRTV
ncbi:MAG: hypothetical protein AAFY90_08690 [Pseudomonadota bacterium]